MNIRELLWEAARSETQRALPILSFPAVQKMDAVADPRRQRVKGHIADIALNGALHRAAVNAARPVDKIQLVIRNAYAAAFRSFLR